LLKQRLLFNKEEKRKEGFTKGIFDWVCFAVKMELSLVLSFFKHREKQRKAEKSRGILCNKEEKRKEVLNFPIIMLLQLSLSLVTLFHFFTFPPKLITTFSPFHPSSSPLHYLITSSPN